MINVIDTKLKDVKIIKPKLFNDTRGYFFESYNNIQFCKEIGKIDFVQDNESLSSFGVLRGLHFQKAPYQQSKLVRVLKGEIQDVVVDIRPDSESYLEYISIILSSKNKKQIFIPKGFAHGFLVLSDEAIVCYKVDQYYNVEYSSGIKYDCPKINIEWNLDKKNIKLSKNDCNLRYINQVIKR